MTHTHTHSAADQPVREPLAVLVKTVEKEGLGEDAQGKYLDREQCHTLPPE